ncbi:tagatose-bisphosphate aldolase, partial [Streptococcus suis]
AFDQRGALKKMIAIHQAEEHTVDQMEELKTLVSEELTQFYSSILLDTDFCLPASRARDEKSGVRLDYSKTGYETSS